ncbi:6-bladed beta-propeller [Chitinophaga ginsengisegetis]|uniref:6-bladed beta-propeller n=1 Tax=Chitinophaga ginsengisegetis TaxID=393003 RepID=UPI000DB910F2|nr:6-bladed beta-propeller [Chitinophaga ginsengisegetis]MDR6568561.1 sugar lactone lactonase YvrE [Chitinophaga ginsengisegetis]MDR6648208.1 sugar lactone lactonase YvrE [Chitinophaga ginsengisegetis]MDR6654642.1 sugar lactone lactonase YvrE [Chitinophaga ginsengisegetis]
MERRKFIQTSALVTASFYISRDLFAKPKGPVYGHNNMRYVLDTKWGTLDSSRYPVKDCHEMVQDKKGRIILLTNETKNNILIYNKSGKLLENWGHEFPGAHGLTLRNENGTEFLFITDTEKHQVYKTTMEGKILLTIDYPAETGVYKKKEEFVPTETTVADNGDFYIADGYGAQYVMRYDRNGKLLGYFGGRGQGDEHLDNAHGIVVDHRKGTPTLIVTDRTRNCFKRFSLDGQLQEVIALPGACVCRPVIKGDHLYAAVLRSPNMDKEGSGFVTILDKDNKVVSNIGGTAPVYTNGKLEPMQQAEKIFVHPHDVCVDNDGNLYVAQWASGKVYPYKLRRV